MSGCVLRAGGDNFDVDQFLSSSSFRPAAIFRRGERNWPDIASCPVSRISGFNLTVSDDNGDDRGEKQVADALAFIERDRNELMRLTSRKDVKTCLDFGCVLRRDAFVKSLRLPVEIVRECAALGIEIEVSVYADGAPADVES
jgi:hypothetical protein